jgi:hypothetical protein
LWQCRINHMAEVAYAMGPALLRATRLLFSIKVNHGYDWLFDL